MITDSSRGEEFTGNGYLEKNLDLLVDHVVSQSDKSLNILVVGRPGSGKSSLDLFTGRYIDPEGFTLENNIAFTHDQFVDYSKNNRKELVTVHSEGRNSFNRTRADRTNITEAQDVIYQWRFKRHLRLIEFQQLRHFDEELLKDEFHAMIRCFYPSSRHKPFAHFYSRARIKKIEFDNRAKKLDYPDPNFRFEWPNPEDEIPELWERYETVNERKLKEDQGNGEDEADVLAEDVKYLTVGEFAERMGIHENTVRNWTKAGKLRCVRLPNNDRRIPESEVQRVVQDPESPDAKGGGDKPDPKHLEEGEKA